MLVADERRNQAIANLVQDEPRDWAIANLYNLSLPEKDRLTNVGEPRWTTLLFGLVAYIYMGLTLFLYLSALAHSSAFGWFFHKLSLRDGAAKNHVLLYRHKYLIGRVSILLYQMFWMAFIGFLVMLLMQIQVTYLSFGEKYKSVNAFLFENWEILYNWVLSNGTQPGVSIPDVPYDDNTYNFTDLTSIALGCFAMIALVFMFYSIVQALIAAQRAALANTGDKEWLAKRGVEPADISPVGTLTVTSAVTLLVPEWRHLTAIVILVWLSALLPWLAPLFIATCVVTLFVGGQRLLRRWSAKAVSPDM